MSDVEDELYSKLEVLTRRLWDGRITRPDIELWLDNFGDETSAGSDRLHALYLLSQFIYFPDREMRELLRIVYSDLYRYSIVEEIRRRNGDTLDAGVIDPLLKDELAATRFLGIGNPAESGTHLLYYFRQENSIPKDRFVSVPQLFDRDVASADVGLKDGAVRRLVFIDDFCGSGSQAIDYSENLLGVLRGIEKRRGAKLHISYLVVAATSSGLKAVKDNTSFDRVASVFELDDSYRSVSPGSRHFDGDLPAGVTIEEARALASKHGTYLWPPHALGYEGGELLLGFHHNVPDNTLPIIWWDELQPPWQPIFKRYQKVYGE